MIVFKWERVNNIILYYTCSHISGYLGKKNFVILIDFNHVEFVYGF